MYKVKNVHGNCLSAVVTEKNYLHYNSMALGIHHHHCLKILK